MISFRELRRDHQRVGLREKDERIIDDRILGAIKRVIAQSAVASHVHVEDEKVALTGEAGTHYGFNDWDGDLHPFNRLYAIENVFIHPRFAGGDLQLSGAGDSVYGVLKCAENGLIR